MGIVREATISGFNEYIQTLKKDKKSNYKFTLTLFDTDVNKPVENVDIKDVEDLTAATYSPDGMTALYDAVCSTIKGVKTTNKKDKVLTVIMTDGQENSSKEYNQKDMKALIEEKTKEGWMFVYLGANQDSYAAAQQFSINMANVSNFNTTAAGVGMTMRTMATNTMAYSGDPTGSATFFTKADQDNLANTK